MKALSISELEEIQRASKPKTAIHVIVHDKYEEFGYDKTQEWVSQTLKDWKWQKYSSTKEYLSQRLRESEQFAPFREQLLHLLLQSGYQKLEAWVNQMNHKGFNKKAIYTLLLELFVLVQYSPDIDKHTIYSDKLGDFLDGFTDWAKNFKILPNQNL